MRVASLGEGLARSSSMYTERHGPRPQWSPGGRDANGARERGRADPFLPQHARQWQAKGGGGGSWPPAKGEGSRRSPVAASVGRAAETRALHPGEKRRLRNGPTKAQRALPNDPHPCFTTGRKDGTTKLTGVKTQSYEKCPPGRFFCRTPYYEMPQIIRNAGVAEQARVIDKQTASSVRQTYTSDIHSETCSDTSLPQLDQAVPLCRGERPARCAHPAAFFRSGDARPAHRHLLEQVRPHHWAPGGVFHARGGGHRPQVVQLGDQRGSPRPTPGNTGTAPSNEGRGMRGFAGVVGVTGGQGTNGSTVDVPCAESIFGSQSDMRRDSRRWGSSKHCGPSSLPNFGGCPELWLCSQTGTAHGQLGGGPPAYLAEGWCSATRWLQRLTLRRMPAAGAGVWRNTGPTHEDSSRDKDAARGAPPARAVLHMTHKQPASSSAATACPPPGWLPAHQSCQHVAEGQRCRLLHVPQLRRGERAGPGRPLLLHTDPRLGRSGVVLFGGRCQREGPGAGQERRSERSPSGAGGDARRGHSARRDTGGHPWLLR